MTDEPIEPKHVERKAYTATLKVMLTEPELLTAGEQLADALQEKARLEGEAKTVADGFKSKIKEQDGKAGALTSLVRSRYEYRQVKCERIFDFEEGVVQEVRLDTGETIKTREMTDEEKQQSLPLDEEETPEEKEEVEEPEKEEEEEEDDGEGEGTEGA